MKPILTTICLCLLLCTEAQATTVSWSTTVTLSNSPSGQPPVASIGFTGWPGTWADDPELGIVWMPTALTNAVTTLENLSTNTPGESYSGGLISIEYPITESTNIPPWGGARISMTLDLQAPECTNSTSDSFYIPMTSTNSYGTLSEWFAGFGSEVLGPGFDPPCLIFINYEKVLRQEKINDDINSLQRQNSLMFGSGSGNDAYRPIGAQSVCRNTNDFGNWGWVYTNNGGPLEYSTNWVLATAFQYSPTNGEAVIWMTNWGLSTNMGFFLFVNTNAP